MPRRTNPYAHVRDLFDPNSLAQTSLFALCEPTAPIVCVTGDGQTFPVLAEVRAREEESRRWEEQFERLATTNEEASGWFPNEGECCE